MGKLDKLVSELNRDMGQAKKTKAKLKLGPRYKFGPIHLYRRIIMGLVSSFDDMFGENVKWTPKNTPFGKHRVSWGEWETRIKKVCPVQFYIREELIPNVIHFFRFEGLKRHWYELKCRYWNPYNVVHVKTLPPTWTDECTLLVHGMSAILERFMTQNPSEHTDYKWEYTTKEECGMSFEDWEKAAEVHRSFWKEINEVWDWWQKKEEREKLICKAYDLASLPERKDLSYFERYKELDALEKQFEKEEEWALQTIVKHRKSLWV